jgi:hypothetical protein
MTTAGHDSGAQSPGYSFLITTHSTPWPKTTGGNNATLVLVLMVYLVFAMALYLLPPREQLFGKSVETIPQQSKIEKGQT